MTGGALIDGGGAMGVVLRHMRGHVLPAATFDEVGRIVGFVGAEGLATNARQSRQHRQRRLALGGAARLRQFGDDREAVAVVGEDMPEVGEMGLLTLRFTIKPAVGVGGGGVGVVRGERFGHESHRHYPCPLCAESSPATPRPARACHRR